jgi:hypothetical protein
VAGAPLENIGQARCSNSFSDPVSYCGLLPAQEEKPDRATRQDAKGQNKQPNSMRPGVKNDPFVANHLHEIRVQPYD